MDRILVLYGTTEGHTAVIAQSIRNALTRTGFEVDMIQAGTIDPLPSNYHGIIVAASVHGGRYQKAVGKWIRAHALELRTKPTAFVSVCLAVLSKDPKAFTDLDGVIGRFTTDLGWRPTVIKSVAGALLYTQYGSFKRWIMKRIVAKAGGATDTSRDYDYTDWNDLKEFAGEFGRRVAAAA